jgi:hypothetical protein
MRTALIIAVLLAFTVPAAADCTATFNPGSGNNGQGVGGRPASVMLNDCAQQSDVTATNNTFNTRFNDLQTQIGNNNLMAQRGVAMAFAAGSLGAGAGAAAAAGAGKAALSAGAGEFEGQWSFAAGISYAVNKRLLLNAGTTVTPFAPVPLVGFSAGATLVLN